MKRKRRKKRSLNKFDRNLFPVDYKPIITWTIRFAALIGCVIVIYAMMRQKGLVKAPKLPQPEIKALAH